MITDSHGLLMYADLSKSTAAKELYEEIGAGLVTKMSWAFTIADEDFDESTNTRIIKRIKKVYDVSAVSCPANPDTEIAARAFCNGVITKSKRETLKRKIRINRLLNKLEVK